MTMFRRNVFAIAIAIVFGLAACQSTLPTAPSSVAVPEPSTVEATAASQTQSAAQGDATPNVAPAEQTDSSAPAGLENVDDELGMAELEISTPGRYANLAFGYIVQYPEAWFTGFGNRPILASFSNLDPGAANRETMRATGCLVEVNVEPNIYGFTLSTLLAQMPQTYSNAVTFQLDGEDAVRTIRDNKNAPYVTEFAQVVHDGRLVTLTVDMARSAQDTCRPVWENLLDQWTWFSPDLVAYRNAEQGYSISYPSSWFVIDDSGQGVVIASRDPSGGTLDDIAGEGMVVRTSLEDNPDMLPLKQWLAANESQLGLTNDIELDTLRGVRSIRTIADDGVEQMRGYFQGPLGRIYVIEATYPSERTSEFRPFANAIMYSFSF